MQDKTDWVRLENMTEEEIEAAARADADNQPLTDEELKQFRRVPSRRKSAINCT
jgi:putative transcriptional regulator